MILIITHEIPKVLSSKFFHNVDPNRLDGKYVKVTLIHISNDKYIPLTKQQQLFHSHLSINNLPSNFNKIYHINLNIKLSMILPIVWPVIRSGCEWIKDQRGARQYIFQEIKDTTLLANYSLKYNSQTTTWLKVANNNRET